MGVKRPLLAIIARTQKRARGRGYISLNTMSQCLAECLLFPLLEIPKHCGIQWITFLVIVLFSKPDAVAK